jgi:hypothetical protein
MPRIKKSADHDNSEAQKTLATHVGPEFYQKVKVFSAQTGIGMGLLIELILARCLKELGEVTAAEARGILLAPNPSERPPSSTDT